MDFSSSAKRSQNILVCGLCDVNTKVKVKCMDCDLYLCDDCKVRHSRFKHADSHSVLAIRDIHLHKDEDRGQPEFKPVKCKIHKAQFCSIFCKSCDDLICPICIVETHQKHNLEKIEIVCKNAYEELKELKYDVHRKTQLYLQELHNVQKNENSKCSEIERILDVKIKAIQDLHTRHARKLLEIDEIRKQLCQNTSLTERRVSNEQEAIKEAEKEIEELLESKNTEKFLDAASNFKLRLKTLSETMNPNEQNFKAFRSISGDFTSAVSTFSNTEIELTNLVSFTTQRFSMFSITSNHRNSVWITDGRKIQHLELTKDIRVIQSHKIPDIEVHEIRCFNENEILLTTSTKILRLAAGSMFRLFKDFSPLKVFTLHVTTKGDIVVGMNLKNVDDKQDRPIIVVLGEDGETKSEYRNSGGQLLKNDIVRCCTVLDGDVICYIDSVRFANPIYGRLVVLNKSGDIQWTYNGNYTINTKDHPFTPIEVISTKNNNIIASDVDQSALHILTSTGSLLTILDLTLLGIKEPDVMALVGCKCLLVYNKQTENKALYKLEISGI